MKRDWFIAEEIPRTHYHLVEAVFEFWGKGMKKDIGMNFDVLCVFKKGDLFFCWPKKQFNEAGKRTLKKTLDTPDWLVKINSDLEKASEELIKDSKKFREIDFSILSDKELEKVFSAHMKIHNKCHVLGMYATVLEWDHELLSNYLRNYLTKKIKEKNLLLKLAETFSLLTTPHKESFQLKQEKEAIEIALKILKNKKVKELFLEKQEKEIIESLSSLNKELDKEIDLHYKKWLWQSYMYIGPPWDKNYFIDEIKGLIKDEKELPLLLNKMTQRVQEVKLKQNKLIKELEIDKKHQTFFGILREFIYLKGLRKDALYNSFFSYGLFLKELGKRLGLSLNQLRHLWPSEFSKAILKKDFNPKELNERFNFSVYVCIDGKSKTVTGKKAEFYAKQVPNPKDYKITELEGSTAVPGMVKGIAKIINLPEDMAKMNQGDVMISSSTNPNLVPAMKKASAIVTDIGGVTCHAAIVSREMNIPCVIGTKIATKVFKDGDLIDVNANHGIVKKVKK